MTERPPSLRLSELDDIEEGMLPSTTRGSGSRRTDSGEISIAQLRWPSGARASASRRTSSGDNLAAHVRLRASTISTQSQTDAVEVDKPSFIRGPNRVAARMKAAFQEATAAPEPGNSSPQGGERDELRGTFLNLNRLTVDRLNTSRGSQLKNSLYYTRRDTARTSSGAHANEALATPSRTSMSSRHSILEPEDSEEIIEMGRPSLRAALGAENVQTTEKTANRFDLSIQRYFQNEAAQLLTFVMIFLSLIALACTTQDFFDDNDWAKPLVLTIDSITAVILTAEIAAILYVRRRVPILVTLIKVSFILDLLIVVSYWVTIAAMAINDISDYRAFFAIRSFVAYRTVRLFKIFESISRALANSALLIAKVAVFLAILYYIYALTGLLALRTDLLEHCADSTEFVPDTEDPIQTLVDSSSIPATNCRADGGGYNCPGVLDCYKVEDSNDYFNLESYDNIGFAILTVYQGAAMEGWSDVMYNLMDSSTNAGLVALFYTTMILFLPLLSINLVIAVVTESFAQARANKGKSRERGDYLNEIVVEENGAWTLKTTKPTSTAHPAVYDIMTGRPMSTVVALILVADFVMLAIYGARVDEDSIVNIWELVISSILGLEGLLKAYALGWRQLRHGRPLFELFLTIGCFLVSLPPIFAVGFLRIVFVLRQIRLMYIWDPLWQQVRKVGGDGSNLRNVVGFVFFVLGVIAIFMMQAFGRESPQFFGSWTESFKSLFRIACGEDWLIILYQTIDQSPAPPVTAIIIVIIHAFCNFLLINLFIAVILENLELPEDLKIEKQAQLYLQSIAGVEAKQFGGQPTDFAAKVFSRLPPNPKTVKIDGVPTAFVPPISRSYLKRYLQGDDSRQRMALDTELQAQQKRLRSPMSQLSSSAVRGSDLPYDVNGVAEVRSGIPAPPSAAATERMLDSFIAGDVTGIGNRSQARNSVLKSVEWEKHYGNGHAIDIDSSVSTPTRGSEDSSKDTGTAVPLVRSRVSDATTLSRQSTEKMLQSSSRRLRFSFGQPGMILSETKATGINAPPRPTLEMGNYGNFADGLNQATTRTLRKTDASNTEAQEGWIDLGFGDLGDQTQTNSLLQNDADFREKYPLYDKTFFIFGPNSQVRAWAREVLGQVETDPRWAGKVWLGFMLVMTTASCVVMVFDKQNEYIRLNDLIYGPILLVDFVINIIADGVFLTPKGYFRNPWNILNFVVLAITLVSMASIPFLNEGTAAYKTFRVLRAIRPFRLLTLLDGVKQDLKFLARGIYEIGTVALILLAFILLSALYGMLLFGGEMDRCNDSSITVREDCVGTYIQSVATQPLIVNAEPQIEQILAPRAWTAPEVCDFDTFGAASLCVFELIGIEGFDSVDDELERLGSASYIYIVFVIVAGSFFFLRLLVGVIVNNFNQNNGTALLTVEQRQWINLKRQMKLISPDRTPSRPKSKWKRRAYDIYTNVWLARTSIALVVMQIVALSTTTSGISLAHLKAVEVINLFACAFYVAEEVLSVSAFGIIGYYRNAAKILDLCAACAAGVVLIIFIFTAGSSTDFSLTAFLPVLVLRIVRNILRSEYLQIILRTLVVAALNLASILVLMMVIISFYSYVAVIFFGSTKFGLDLNRQANFEAGPITLLTLYRILSGEDWNSVMRDTFLHGNECTDNGPTDTDCGNQTLALIFFISYYLIMTYVFLNMFVAVVIESFSHFLSIDDEASLQLSDLYAFRDNWSKFDTERRGYIPVTSVRKFLTTLPKGLGLDVKNNSKLYRYIHAEIASVSTRDGLGRQVVDFHKLLYILAVNAVDVVKAMTIEEYMRRQEQVRYIREKVAAELVLGYLKMYVLRRRYKQMRNMAHMLEMPDAHANKSFHPLGHDASQQAHLDELISATSEGHILQHQRDSGVRMTPGISVNDEAARDAQDNSLRNSLSADDPKRTSQNGSEFGNAFNLDSVIPWLQEPSSPISDNSASVPQLSRNSSHSRPPSGSGSRGASPNRLQRPIDETATLHSSVSSLHSDDGGVGNQMGIPLDRVPSIRLDLPTARSSASFSQPSPHTDRTAVSGWNLPNSSNSGVWRDSAECSNSFADHELNYWIEQFDNLEEDKTSFK
eukprot:Clim_evm63s153 gene=Clim_evmTU63s153